MRVALVFPDFLSTVVLARDFIKALVRNPDNQVYVICQVEEYHEELETLNVTYFDVDIYRFISPLKDLRYFYKLYQIFSQQDIDVVINWTHKPNIYGTFAAKLAGVKTVICAIRGLGLVFLDENSLKAKLLKSFVSFLYWIVGKLCNKIWFTNPDDLNYFLRKRLITKSKYLLTSNAINIKYFSAAAVSPEKLGQLRQELGLPSYGRVVVMVGRMIWSKGVREFIEASQLLKDRFPEVTFLLVGPLDQGSPYAVPEEYLRDSEKSGNFRWLGFRRDVRELYALADLAVFPSYYMEGGYPRAVLEPMALGKPVITTDTPGCRAPVAPGKNGFLIPPRDSQALAEAMATLLQDEPLRQEFGKCSRRKVEQEFDERLVTEKIINEVSVLSGGNYLK